MTDDVYVKVECLAIPDGFIGKAVDRRLRLSLILRPEPDAPSSAVLLKDWPTEIPKLIFEAKFAATVKELDAATALTLTPEYEANEKVVSNAAKTWWETRLWKDGEVFKSYVDLMRSSGFTAAPVGFSSYSFLADMARRRVENDVQMGLLGALHRTNAAPKDLDRLKRLYPALAVRLEHPGDPASHLADMQALVAREVFADLPIGDAVGPILANAGGSRAIRATNTSPVEIDALLQACFNQSEDAILGRSSKAVGGLKPSNSWNPFVPLPEGGAHTLAEVVGNRYESSLFGPPLQAPTPSTLGGQTATAGGQGDEVSFPRLAVAAFEQMMSSTASEAPEDCSEASLYNLARHHVAALQAHPALRKFVRLIVDVPLPIDDIPYLLNTNGDVTGVVSVVVKGAAEATKKIATAFIFNLKEEVFEPCPEHSFSTSNPLTPKPRTSKVPSLPLDKGVVMLDVRQQNQNNMPRRFRMEVVDATASYLALRHAIQTTLQASRKGLSANQASGDPPSLKTRGLMLLDTEANVTAVIAKERAVWDQAQVDDATRLFFAEALVDGYRPDVVKEKTVFPLAARSLRYSVIDDALKHEHLPLDTYADTAHRDEGYVSSGAMIVEGGKASERQYTSEQLFCWTGNSLGLPAVPDKKQPLLHGLPTTITASFHPTEKGPILRMGERYRYMLRARKLNGSSVPTAFSATLSSRYSLGDEHGKDYLFMPVERTPAPTVLVPAGQRLVRVDQQDDQPSSQVVLLNTGETAKRVLISPRVGFDLAEQQGQFDPKATALYRTHGTYRNLERNDKGSVPPYIEPGAENPIQQALLFKVIKVPSGSTDAPYYVDRSLCLLGCSLTATNATTRHAIRSQTAEGVSFWHRSAVDKALEGQGFDTSKIRPVLLECVAVPSGQSGVYNSGEPTLEIDGQSINVVVLRVEVAPGDTLSLEVWTNRTAEFALDQSLIARAWGPLASHLHLDATVLDTFDTERTEYRAAREDGWAKLTCGTRIAPLNEVVCFRIEHGVPVPLQPPRFLQVFGCTRAQNREQWEKLCASGVNRTDQPDAETTFMWGSIAIDRKTTEAVWAEAIWREVDPALARVRTIERENDWTIEQTGLWSYQPGVGQGRLFDIPAIPALATKDGEDAAAYAARADRLDLVTDDQGVLRNLTGDFKSDKARRLLVRLLARSRFAAPSAHLDESANCSASATREDFLAALNGGALPNGVEEVWLPATRPPAPPRLMKDQGSLYLRRFDTVTGGSASQKGKRLTHVYRCWLDSGWFSSGEGEKLAVICRDPSQGEQPDWLISKLSRWGGDMTMRPPIYLKPASSSLEAPTFLDPFQIVGMTSGGGELCSLSWDKRSDASARFQGVRLALLEPTFHSGTGRWYCDIELVPVATFRVCLRLSLARYQACAIEGCHLSEPVLADAFVLHQPWSFLAERRNDVVEISVTGPAYTQRAPLFQGLMPEAQLQGLDALAAEPLVLAELERLDRLGGRPLPVMGTDGQRVATTSRQAIRKEHGWPTAAEDIEEGWTRWVMQMAIPPGDAGARYAVRLTLASAHASSSAARSNDVDGALVYLPEPLVVQLDL